MSATPTNANFEIPEEGTQPGAQPTGKSRARTSYDAPGREALQTLLAFSSLHDQIRRRHEHTPFSRTEHFVPDEVLQLITERALAITGADGIAIALAEGNLVRCRAAAGEIAPDVGVRLDPNSGFSGACFRSGLIVRCDDTEKDPRVDQEACRRIGVRSIVAVPLLTEHGVAGLIAAFCRGTHGVSDGDIRSLSLLAELALAAVRPEEELPPLRRSALWDSETPRATESSQPQPSSENGSVELGTEASTATQKSDLANHDLPNLDTLRSTLSPVTAGRAVANATPAESSEDSAEDSFTPIESSRIEFSENEPHKSRTLVTAIVVLALLALVLTGLTLWWWYSNDRAAARPTQAATNSRFSQEPAFSPRQTTGETVPEAAKEAPSPEMAREAASRQITGIRHWSSADSSTVAIDLQEQVQYEAHRLSNPERIYFDLRDTTLAAGIPGNIEVGDALLSRVRVAQPTNDLTRVVLETKNNANFSVKLETNPYRLLIEVRSATAKPKSSVKVDLFAPLNSAGKNSRSNAATPERGTWLAPADTFPDSQTAALQGPGHGLRIVLDAGHGGWDMGTVGRKGLLEKDLVLDIVARLGKLVTDHLGAEVIYTRRDDTYVPLEKRTEVANFAQADLFLSVHANYSDSPNARGVETYYTNTYSSAHARLPDNGAPDALNVEWLNVDIRDKVQQSRGFADNVQQALYRTLAGKGPGLRNRGVKEASYVVLTGTTMPAILAEVSFVSSPEDETKLEDSTYRQEIAEGLYKGLAAFAAGSQRRVNVASASARTGGQ